MRHSLFFSFCSITLFLVSGPLTHGLQEPVYAQLGWRQDCRVDRLFVVQAAPWAGLNNKLIDLRNGLMLAMLTNRTYVLPPLKRAYGFDLRFSDIVDIAYLRSFWPCMIESENLEELYDDAWISGELGKRVLAWEESPPNARLADVARWGNTVGRDFPILKMDAIFFLCPEAPDLERRFWAAVQGSPVIAAEVAALRHHLLNQGRYVAVHLRWLDGHCDQMTQNFFSRPELQASVLTMCHFNHTTVAEMIAAKGWDVDYIYVASDGQRPKAEKTFQENGGVFYKPPDGQDKSANRGSSMTRGLTGHEVFMPAVDMFMLVDADYAVGNMVSTMATNVAAIRAAVGKPMVLGWPEPKQHFKQFFSCSRTCYWCGTDTGPDPVMGFYNRTDCYPVITSPHELAPL